MNLKNAGIICVALAGGFLLGERFEKPKIVRAQSMNQVYIDSDNTPGIAGGTRIQGSQIVGFSCVEDGNSPTCYIASTK